VLANTGIIGDSRALAKIPFAMAKLNNRDKKTKKREIFANLPDGKYLPRLVVNTPNRAPKNVH
jgi:hypothetical protein